MLEARKAVVKALEEKGLLVKVDETYENRMGYCYKCGTIIEPMLMEQWFVNMEPLAAGAIKVLEEGKITFYPEAKKDQLVGYLKGLRDWNISRQIAWGIPIPAFQNVDDPNDWIYDERVKEKTIKVDGKTYRRDSDVFDTWFSSSSWPYATLNFGDPKNDDFNNFYPLSLMETGGEILYPWVSRMIMLGLYVTGDIPFKSVYIHGYVMSEDGSKMSKSLGNVINAPEVVEKYGADALRMGIVAGRVPAVNRGYDSRKVEEARNFCNKLWNIARYVEDKVGDKPAGKVEATTDADHWILGKLGQATNDMADHLENYRFAEAYDTLYHFVWDDFADWYIEASKAAENPALLAFGLESILKLMHPFAPFVTETIWQTLSKDGVLATAEWPTIPAADTKRAKNFEEIRTIVSEARGIIKAVGAGKVPLTFADAPVIEANTELLKRLAKLGSVSFGAQDGVKLTSTAYDVRLGIPNDLTKKYSDKLQTSQDAEEQAIKRLKERLSNKSYVANAPAQVVSETKRQLAETEARLQAIKGERARFSS